MYKDHETPRFWVTYSDALRKYISKRVKDKEVVEDLLHDVYVKIFCYCKRYEFSCEKAGVKNLRSWVFQTCYNTLIDHFKKNSKYSYGEDLEEICCVEEPDLLDERPLPLEAVLKALPPKYSQPLTYDLLFSMKQAEIAEKLGISLAATKSRIQRGRQMVAEQYLALAKK